MRSVLNSIHRLLCASCGFNSHVEIVTQTYVPIQTSGDSSMAGTDHAVSSRSSGSWWGNTQPSATPTPSPSSHFQPVPTPESTTGTNGDDAFNDALGRSGAEVRGQFRGWCGPNQNSIQRHCNRPAITEIRKSWHQSW